MRAVVEVDWASGKHRVGATQAAWGMGDALEGAAEPEF